MQDWIPLSTPSLQGNEWHYIKDCLDTGWVSSVGSYVNRFEEMIREYTGCLYAIATTNGTAALHIALQVAGVKAGDIVIVPTLTFVATANAVAYTGATPYFIDADPQTWQMDSDVLFHFLEKNTEMKENVCYLKSTGQRIAAIVPVHVLGHPDHIDDVCSIGDRFQIPIVEDSTEALGSTFRGKHVGTFGLLGTLSFNGNKLITTGGGGMILTNDEALAKRAKHLTTQAKADPIEYFHDEIGYNYRLVNVLAALGCAQMEQLNGFIKRHHEIYATYRAELEDLEDLGWQGVIHDSSPNHWLTTIQFPRAIELLSYLHLHKIQARRFWVPMHRLPMFSASPYIQQLNVANQLYDNAISLPSSSHLTSREQAYIIRTIREFYGKA